MPTRRVTPRGIPASETAPAKVSTVIPGMAATLAFRAVSPIDAEKLLETLVTYLAPAVRATTTGSLVILEGVQLGPLQAGSVTNGTCEVVPAHIYLGLRQGRPTYLLQLSSPSGSRTVSTAELARAMPSPQELGKWLYWVVAKLTASASTIAREVDDPFRAQKMWALQRRCLAR